MKRKPTSTAAMAVAATLIVLAQILPAQDFTVQMKDEDGRSIATHYISRNAVRNVSSEPVDSDMIYRLDTGKIITLNHKQKTYGEIAAAEMRQLIEKKQVSMSPEKQEAMRRLGCERQRQVGVPAARRVVVNADAVEASRLAAGDELGEIGQRPPDRNPQCDTDPGHLASSLLHLRRS